jgi:hypothetical protein
MGGVYGNPRPLTTPSCNIATRRPSPRHCRVLLPARLLQIDRLGVCRSLDN